MKCLSLLTATLCLIVFSCESFGEQQGPPNRGNRAGQRGPGFGGPGGGGPGFGGPGGGRAGRGGPGGQRGGGNPLMRIIDRDGDGTLSANEIDNAAAALRRMDRNNNGSIEAAEMQGNRRGGQGRAGMGPQGQRARGQRGQGQRGPGQGGFGAGRGGQGPGAGGPGGGGPGGMDRAQMAERIFSQNDVNNDGELSQDEAPERMAQMFDRLDANGDGAIQKAELSKMFANGGPGGGGGRGREAMGRGRRGGNNIQGVRPQRPAFADDE